MEEEYNDITQTGYNNWSELQNLNDQYQGTQDYVTDNPPKQKMTQKQYQNLLQQQETARRKQNLMNMGIVPHRGHENLARYNPDMFNVDDEPYVSPIANTSTPFGESRYDENAQGLYQLEHIQDVRANNQSGFNKLMAGTAKAAVLAGTTWLDGTVGLVYGLSSAAVSGAKDLMDDGKLSWNGQNAAKIFDNEISNGLRFVNQEVENTIPNYHSEEEESRAWYQNMGTANFWADFLKQLGFTVGAYYSGAAWTKTLKTIGLVKSPLGARFTGSFLSGVNEGRIEANQIQDEHYNREVGLLDDQFKKQTDNIMSQYYNGILDDSEANAELERLYNINELNKQKIKENSDKVGLIDLAINVPILTLDNMLMFGKAYSRGFNNANKAVNESRTFWQRAKNLRRSANEQLGMLEDEVVKNTEKTVGGYGWNTITKGQAALKGLGHFVREGNEEMMQAYASEMASALYQPDSPDAYYQALYDPNALDNTKDFYTSAIEGFSKSYGNLDRWQEFIMGGLTGLIGTVTFGKGQNQSPDTYVGKGKRVGITGGILGELAAANYYNRKGQANVDFMNDYIQSRQKDFDNKIRHFAMSDHFNTLMNGWAEESNRFEYENAKDNDDFQAIVRFNNAGRLQDLKDMISNDFTDFSDDDLAVIATSQDSSNQWRNPDGSYMSESEEGRAKMREKLEQNRVTLLKDVQEFENIYESIVNSTNDNLTDEQNLELSWLKWKIGKFNDRYANIKETNRQFFQMLRDSASEYVNAFDDSLDESKLSEEDKKKYQFGKTVVNNAKEIIKLIDLMNNSNSALEYQRKAGLNYKLLNQIMNEDTYDLFASQTSMTYDQYRDTIQNLLDAAKLGIAANQFDERLQEFLDNPAEIEKKHSKVRQKVDKAVDGFKSNKQADSMMDMDIEILSDEIDKGNVTRDENGDIVNGDGLNITKNVGGEKGEQIKKKFDQADKRVKKKNEIVDVVLDDNFESGNPNVTQRDKDAIVEFVGESFEQGQFKHIEELDMDAIDDSMMLTDYEIEDTTMSDDEKRQLAQKRKTILLVASTQAQQQLDKADEIKSRSPQDNHDGNETDPGEQTGVNDPVEKQKPVNAQSVQPEQKSPQTAQNKPQIESDVQSAFIGQQQLNEDQPVQPESYPIAGVNSGLSELPLSDFRKRYNISDKDYRSYGEIVADLTKYDFEEHKPGDMSKMSDKSEEYVRYVCETDKFLLEHRAFENRFNKSVAVGKKVYFGFSDKLNGDAGIPVVLILDENRNVIGNLNPLDTNPVIESMVGYLLSMTNPEGGGSSIETILDNDNNPIESYINQEYIGRIPYSIEQQPINVVYTNPSDIRFGIVKESGVEAGVYTSKSDNPNRDVRPPKKAAVGQVFVLLKSASSDRPYVTVNIYTPRYGDEGTIINGGRSQTAFDRYVHTVIDRIVLRNEEGKVDDAMAVKIKDQLNQLFSGQNFGIECENGRITYIHIGDNQGNSESGRQVIYSRNEELTSQLLYDRIVEQRMPINISISKINKPNIISDTGTTYNGMISEISRVSLVPGSTHTLGDFFSIDLLDENGNILRTEKPVSRPMHSITETKVTLADGSVINKDNWDVIENGITYDVKSDVDIFVNNKDGFEGAKRRLLARAQEYASSNRALGEDQNKIVNLRFNETFYLQYNTQTRQLIIPQGARTEHSDDNVTPTSTSFTQVDIDMDYGTEGQFGQEMDYPSIDWQSNDINIVNDWFENSGLSGDYQYIWDNIGDNDRKKIYSVREMLDMDEILNDYELFGKSERVDDLLKGGQFRQVDNETNTERIRKEESDWLKEFYPELSLNERLKVVDGLIKISNNKNAWGMFNNGMMVLSDKAATGTLYHEAFHAISHLLMTPEELKSMLNIVRRDNPNMSDVELEEVLAEDFRGYMQTEVSMHRDNAIVRFFKMLRNVLIGWKNRQYVLTNAYYRISQGIYADKKMNNPVSTRQAREYQNSKYDFDNLSESQKDYLDENGITQEMYELLSQEEKDNLWGCIV